MVWVLETSLLEPIPHACHGCHALHSWRIGSLSLLPHLRNWCWSSIKKDPLPAAFSYSWMVYSWLVPEGFQVNNSTEHCHINRIQQILMQPFQPGPNNHTKTQMESLNEEQLLKKLLTVNKKPLKFVCYSLDLLSNTTSGSQVKGTKNDFTNLLVQ